MDAPESLKDSTSVATAKFKREQEFAPDQDFNQLANAVVKASSYRDEKNGSTQSDLAQDDREQFLSNFDNETATKADSEVNSDLRMSYMSCLKSAEKCVLYDSDPMNKAENMQRIKFHCPPKSIFSPVLKA